MGMWTILFWLFLSVPFSFPGEIYRWTDEKGTVHFTDNISNVPARYRNQVEKKEGVEESPRETEKQIVPRGRSEIETEAMPPNVRIEEKQDRVKEYLRSIEEKIQAKKELEKKISKLEEELNASEERIRYLEKDEKENDPLIQPQRSRGKFAPVASRHYREKQILENRIKSIKEEIATLEEKLSSIRRSL